MVGQLCLNGAMRLFSTRHPVVSDRESRNKHRKQMVEALNELSTTMVT
jgi:hypothetical protein